MGDRPFGGKGPISQNVSEFRCVVTGVSIGILV